MIKLCQEAAAAQRMTFLFVFGKAGILYVTSQVGRNRNKASALSTHFSVSPPSVSFLLSFPPSTLPVSWLSSSLCSAFSLTGTFFLLPLSFFFFKCVCVIDLLCRRLPGESLKWSFLLMNQTPLIEHGWLWDDITHMRTLWPSHSPQSFIHNNRHNQLFRMRDEGRRGVSE